MPTESTPDLFVALDLSDKDRLDQLLRHLDGLPVGVKVGHELFQLFGPEIVRRLSGEGFKVFVDLKLHDIPNTVEKAVTGIIRNGAQFFTLHLAGGPDMVRAAMRACAASGKQDTIALGVSVMTSFDRQSWSETIEAVSAAGGRSIDPAESVLSMVNAGLDWGVNGCVASAHEAAALSELSHRRNRSLYILTPGIRPSSQLDRKANQKDDQKRVMTPAQAKAAGASGIVVGRPIYESPDPRAMTQSILDDLKA